MQIYKMLPTNFTPNTGLDSTTIACLANPSPSCDASIGSITMGSGICYTNSSMVLCACVNSATACPELTNPYCGNSPEAYHPTYATDCSDVKLCVNNTLLTGSNNVMGSTVQVCSDADITDISLPLKYMLLIILFIISAVLTVTYIRENVASADRAAKNV